MTLPEEITFGGWTGSGVATGRTAEKAAQWGARGKLPPEQGALPFEPFVDATAWADENVGYGVLLPDGEPVPAPIERLLAARPGTVLLRWGVEPEGGRRWKIRRVSSEGAVSDLQIGLTKFGIGEHNRLPRYILIAAPPDRIPWEIQYALSIRHSVGRLPFVGDELGNYIDAMLTDWNGAEVDATAPLLWTVDHGPTDITRLMRDLIAVPLKNRMTGTLDNLRCLTAGEATAQNLCDALSKGPALVVTSSHGSTPLGDPELLRATLGLPVDHLHQVVPLTDLLSVMPYGAIWFAQACCSAGSVRESSYAGLLDADSTAGRVLEAISSNGTTVSPAAWGLLSRQKPVRAVFGHVEPTFDWTLRDPVTGQSLCNELIDGLTTNLYSGRPLGLVFENYDAGVGVLHSQWAEGIREYAGGATTLLDGLTRLRLTALDRQGLVLLGDPTAVLPRSVDFVMKFARGGAE